MAPIYLVPDVLQKSPEYIGGMHLTDYPYRDYYERYDTELGAKAPYWPLGETLGMQNPYWTVNRNMINREKNRWLAGIGLKYDLTSWFDVAARFNYDQDKETGIQKLYATALKPRQMGELDSGCTCCIGGAQPADALQHGSLRPRIDCKHRHVVSGC